MKSLFVVAVAAMGAVVLLFIIHLIKKAWPRSQTTDHLSVSYIETSRE